MIQNVLRSLGGIENYGIISLCLFVAVFAAMVIWAFLKKRAYLDHMARMPLENETNSNPINPHE
jgi:hypothetical protein